MRTIKRYDQFKADRNKSDRSADDAQRKSDDESQLPIQKSDNEIEQKATNVVKIPNWKQY